MHFPALLEAIPTSFPLFAVLLAAGVCPAQQPCSIGLQPTLGPVPGGFGGIQALASFDAGNGPRLYAGGFFDRLPGDDQPPGTLRYLARFNGVNWEQVGGGIGGAVEAFAVGSLGGVPMLVMGGYFVRSGGAPSDYIAAFDGQNWSTVLGDANAPVLALGFGRIELGGSVDLYAGGSFNSIGGVPVGRVARFTGTSWTNLPGLPGNGPEGSAVLDMQFVPLGLGISDLYVAGEFDHGVCQYINGWKVVGGSVGFSNTVHDIDAIPVAPGVWHLFAGGAFTHFGNLPMPRAAQWTGQQWIQLPEGGFNGTVRAIGGSTGGGPLRLIAAGDFTATSAGTAAPGVALLQDSVWTGVTGFDRPPQFIDAQLDPFGGGTAVLIAGEFTTSPQADGFIARLAACPAGFADIPGCQPAPLDLRAVSGTLKVAAPLLLRASNLPSGPGLTLLFVGQTGVDLQGCGTPLPGLGELLLSLAPSPSFLADAAVVQGESTIGVQVPNNPALVGKTVTFQAAHLALTPGNQVQLSDALEASIAP